MLCLLSASPSSAATDSLAAGRYRSSVSDTNGHAIAGALVEVYRYQEQPEKDLELATILTTGADGTFEIPWVNYTHLIARKPGLAPSWRQLTPTATNRGPMVLSPPTRLAGVVVDESAKPVSQAEVFVCAAHIGATTEWSTLLGARLARQLFSTRTDSNGRFEIDSFPANSTAELGVRAPGKVLPPRRVQYSPKNLLWRSGQQDIRLVVEPPAQLAGKVETESGEPLTNAWVELRPTGSSFDVGPWESVSSVRNGGFQFIGVASGAYQLFAKFATNQLPDWVADPVPVAVHPGEFVQGIVINATMGGVLRVRCIDKPTGKPFKGTFLTLYAASEYLHQTSDNDGLGWFRMLPGRYDLHGTTDEGLHKYAPVQVEAGQTNDAILEFSPPPVVTGVVRDPSGQPAPGLNVWPTQRPKTEIKTDPEGRYKLVHKENPQVVVVVDGVHNLAVSREIEDGITNLDLHLAPALTVTGRVEDSQGKPIPKAKALVYLHSGTWGLPVYWQPITTDAQGAFNITNLPADRTYYLQVNAPGYGSAQPKVPTDAGNLIDLPPVVLQKAALKLCGRVADASDAPLANASIHVNGNGQPDSDVLTDSQGRFALEVCPGKVPFSVRFEDLQTSVEANAGETNLVVVLKPRSRDPEGEKPKRPSLAGKALPSLAMANLPTDAAALGKPLLLCLFDCDQRPSRQVIRLIADQYDSLRRKGVSVLAIQAAVASDSFSSWSTANPVPFPLGRITEKNVASTWATETDMLPWLILVNSQGRVSAEGFPLDDLASKLAAFEK